MKNISLSLLAFLLVFVGTHPESYALTSHYQPISCSSTGYTGAYAVTDIDALGHIVRSYGVDCNGNHWEKGACTISMERDPGWSYDYMISEPVNNAWYVKYTIGSNGQVSKYWGRDVNGEYWESTECSGKKGELGNTIVTPSGFELTVNESLSTDHADIGFFSPVGGNISFELLDIRGQLIARTPSISVAANTHSSSILNVPNLAQGSYILAMRHNGAFVASTGVIRLSR